MVSAGDLMYGYAVSHPCGIYWANVRVLAERFVQSFYEGTGVMLRIADEKKEAGDVYDGYETYSWSDPAERDDPA
jgi:hypothetical protein